MYAVIPVAIEADNPTLELAIESIHRHTNYDVVTIGHDHCLGEHIYMPQSPLPGDRFTNTDNAMRLACEHFDTFIWTADDIYWMRPAEPQRWALGDLTTTIRRGEYGRRKQATLQWLTANGLPTWDYEAHVPIPITAAPMLAVLDIITTVPMLDKRSLYGNITGAPDVIAPDVKMHTAGVPDAPWISSVGARHWDIVQRVVGHGKAA